MLSLNQRKRKNGCRNILMIKSSQKNVPHMRIDCGASCIPRSIATDRATAPGFPKNDIHTSDDLDIKYKAKLLNHEIYASDLNFG